MRLLVAHGERDCSFSEVTTSKNQMPLRDERFPDGFNWLSGCDRLRTEVANILNENAMFIAQVAIDLSIAFCNFKIKQFDVEKSTFQSLFCHQAKSAFDQFSHLRSWWNKRQEDMSCHER